MSSPSGPPPRVFPPILGGFGLGLGSMLLQSVWVRRWTAGLGQELPAILVVTAAFLSGQALGAWSSGLAAAGGRVTRPGPGILSVIAASGSLLSLPLIPFVQQLLMGLLGESGGPAIGLAVSFVAITLVLLPATGAMGALWPELAARAESPRAAGRGLAAFYAANTAGALAGLGAAVAWLLPEAGLVGSTWVGAAILATLGLVPLRGHPEGSMLAVPQATVSDESRREAGEWRVVAAASGLLGVSVYLVGVKALGQASPGTVYHHAAALGTYLAGMALGGLVSSWSRHPVPLAVKWSLLAGAVIAEAWCLRNLVMGGPAAGVLSRPWLLAPVVLLVPSMLMGWTFPDVASKARDRAALGRLVAANTLGSALAPALVGFIFIPLLGTRWTWGVLAAGYSALGWMRAGSWNRLAALGLACAACFLPHDLHLQQVRPGATIVEIREGLGDTAAVIESGGGQRVLRSNNRFVMGGTASAAAERKHSLLPLMLHPDPRRALFLGVGTGISFSAMARPAGLAAEGVEIDPAVAALMRHFSPHNDGVQTLPLHLADARRFIRATPRRYDVIVADLFHPARDGAGLLYTVEHFRAIRSRLEAGGVFCQWLPLYQMDEGLLQLILRSYLEVFPESDGWLLRFNADVPVLGLMGWLNRPEWGPGWTERRRERMGGAELLRATGLGDDRSVFGLWLGDAAWLRAIAGSGRGNTDDRPRLVYDAARWEMARGNGNESYRVLEWLMGRWGAGGGGGAPGIRRLDSGSWEAYDRARQAYVGGLISEVKGETTAAEAAFLKSVRDSADFTLGYAQILTRASTVAGVNPEGAKRLLEALREARPERPHARELLERMRLR